VLRKAASMRLIPGARLGKSLTTDKVEAIYRSEIRKRKITTETV